VFALRRTRPDAERPYRTWGYPLVPAIFLVFYVFFLVAMYMARPMDRMIGLGLISLGAAVYFIWGTQRTQNDASAFERS
jgi:APA family basic amino acid/polyamine antiporter